MVKSMVNSCIPEFSDFSAMGPWYCAGASSLYYYYFHPDIARYLI